MKLFQGGNQRSRGQGHSDPQHDHQGDQDHLPQHADHHSPHVDDNGDHESHGVHHEDGGPRQSRRRLRAPLQPTRRALRLNRWI